MSFLFGFLVLASACTPAAEKGDEAETTSVDTTATDDAAEPQVVASTEAYTTVILEDGIASPRKEMKGSIGDAGITINYGSPSMKERTIWGDLVPFGELWRTGANAGTTIEISQDVTVEGEALPAGKYSIFTIPSEDNVIVIFNKEPEQRGTGGYNEAEDALRVTVTPQAQDADLETLEFMISGDNIVMAWANWQVPVAVAAAAAE